MQAHMKRNSQFQSDAAAGPSTQVLDPEIGRNFADGVVPTTEIPWPEPSLQELLSQPVLDLQFLEAAVRGEYSQGIYWPDMHVDS